MNRTVKLFKQLNDLLIKSAPDNEIFKQCKKYVDNLTDEEALNFIDDVTRCFMESAPQEVLELIFPDLPTRDDLKE